MTVYGYARVSTADQNLDHQTDALQRAGVPAGNLFTDTASGAKASRPELDRLLALLQPGDTVKITRLDRLSRSVQHLINLGADLRAREIELHVVEQGIDTSTAEGRAMFGMLSVLAELQRELIVANTRDGLAAARARGRVGGRRPKLTQRQLDQAQHMYDSGQHTVEEIADTFHVSRPTLYRHLTAHHESRDCVLIVYRNTRTKTDAGNRRLGAPPRRSRRTPTANGGRSPLPAAPTSKPSCTSPAAKSSASAESKTTRSNGSKTTVATATSPSPPHSPNCRSLGDCPPCRCASETTAPTCAGNSANTSLCKRPNTSLGPCSRRCPRPPSTGVRPGQRSEPRVSCRR